MIILKWWEKILKDEQTEIVAMLEEKILPGYSVRLDIGSISTGINVVVSKFPALRNKTFRFYDLHDMGPRLPANTEPNAWRRFVEPVRAAIVGLDLFLREVDRNRDFDKIDDNNYEMTLSSDRVKIKFTLGRSCDSAIYDPDEDTKAEMCLSYRVNENTPASGDSWLAIYLTAKMLLNTDLDRISELADRGVIPDVLENAMLAILEEEFVSKCQHCENVVEEGDGECSSCGYYVTEVDTSEITVHEGGPAFIYVYPSGWDCPYDGEFIQFDESCYFHGAECHHDGPNYGFSNNGIYLSRTQTYRYGDFILQDPDHGFEYYNIEDAKDVYVVTDLLLDLMDYTGIVEAAELLSLVEPQRAPQGGWIVDTGDGIFYWNGDNFTEYNPDDEEADSEKMQNLRNILNEYGMELDIDGATDDELNTIVEEEIENMGYALESLKESVPNADEEQIESLENYIYELREFLE